MNGLIYTSLGNTYHQPTPENYIIFSKGITKISVDDKAAVPIGEPGLPIRTNVKSMSNGAIKHINKWKNNLALDHDFHRANIRPSIALIIKTLNDNTSWKNGAVTPCLKDAALEPLSSMRYSVELTKQIQHLGPAITSLLLGILFSNRITPLSK